MSELYVNPTQAGTNDRIEGQLKQAIGQARKGELKGILVLGVRLDGEVAIGSCLTPDDLIILGRKVPEVLAYLAKNLKAAVELAGEKGLRKQ